MSKYKQIEEMAKVIVETERRKMDTHCDLPSAEEYATDIYNADYRKQSGWISVDEKSPDEEKAYIIVTDGETVIVARRAWLYRSNSDGRLRCPANYGNGMYITHWMPLPKPPKMRKEDEGK